MFADATGTGGYNARNDCGRVGIARQTYSAIECGRKPMSWNTFMSLILLLRANEKTKDIIKILGIYTEDLENYINMQNQE